MFNLFKKKPIPAPYQETYDLINNDFKLLTEKISGHLDEMNKKYSKNDIPLFRVYSNPSGRIYFTTNYDGVGVDNPFIFSQIVSNIETVLNGASAKDIIDFIEGIKEKLLKDCVIKYS